MGLQEIEKAIEALSPEHRERLSEWFDQRYAQPIDGQLKADLDAGQLDGRIERALSDRK